jgi:hypothetical protein
MTVLVLALVAGTAAAFAVAERLKLERAPVTDPNEFDREFSPVCRCDQARATLPLRFRRAAVVTASIRRTDGTQIRVIAVRERVRKGAHVYTWDGRDEAGGVVPDGRYFLNLEFHDSKSAILLPVSIRVDTRPPRLTVRDVSRLVISPDGDSRGDRVSFSFRTNERVAAASILVNGEVSVRSGPKAKRLLHVLHWPGKVDGERAPAEYELELVVRDDAGNEARERRTIRVRYVQLDRSSYQASAGGELSFIVDLDAKQFSWALLRRRADGTPGRRVERDQGVTDPAPVVSLAALVPGEYLLRVRIPAGGEAIAPVTVGPAQP